LKEILVGIEKEAKKLSDEVVNQIARGKRETKDRPEENAKNIEGVGGAGGRGGGGVGGDGGRNRAETGEGVKNKASLKNIPKSLDSIVIPPEGTAQIFLVFLASVFSPRFSRSFSAYCTLFFRFFL
jgi:hypothetical protein